jgi:hypothetical protein
LVVSSLVFVLAVLEAYLRSFDPQSLRLSRPDPVLGWNHVPNTSGIWRKSCFSTEIKFNSEGMRDVEHDLNKPVGTYRIAVIGDSFVTAQEVEFDETFFRQLQHILNKRGYESQVLGFGVRGFGTGQAYQLLAHYALKYDPDLVILSFMANDVRNNLLALEKNPAKPYFEPQSDGTLKQQPFTPMPDHSGSWKSTLFEYLHTVRFLYFAAARIPWIHNALAKFGVYANIISKPTGPDDLLVDTVFRDPPWPSVWEEAWQVTKGLLRSINSLSVSSGARFILFSAADFTAVEDRPFKELEERHPGMALKYDNMERRLATFSVDEGIAYVSSLPAMRDLQAGGKSAHFDCDGHWTRDAHKRAAELLADYLIAGGYI